MADIHWLNPVSGDFNTGTNWTGGTVPTASDNVFLDAVGAAFTVSESPHTFQQISTLHLAANATLAVGYYDNFQILPQSGASIGVNAGAIQVSGGHSDLVLGQGTFSNSGTIELGNGELLVQAATATTLDGGGQVVLDGGFGSSIGQVVGALNNVDNTIAGGGFITTTLSNDADGVVDANGAGGAGLYISNDSITNNGLLESTGGPGLDIRRGANVDQTGGGRILAANGASVVLETVQIAGGTLTTTGTGVVLIEGQTLLDGSASALTNRATIDLISNVNGYSLTLKGAIDNAGTIAVDTGNSTGRVENLIVNPAGVTLTGAGAITLDGDGKGQIIGSQGGATLTNVDNTISGTGTIGGTYLTLINQAKGVIDANAAGGLTIAGVTTNIGTVLAGGGAIAITGALTNLSGSTLTGGVFEADANSTLSFNATSNIATDNATLILNGVNSAIQGGAPLESTLIAIRKAGVLEILGGRNWTSSVSLSNAGTLNLGGGTFTTATLTNGGRISGFGALAATLTNTGTLAVQSHATLSLVGGLLTNLSGSTLTGGVYSVATKGVLQLANNVTIATLDATVDLAGAGATVQSLNTSTSSQVTLGASLAAVGSGGALEILGGASLATTHTLTNAGAISIGGGTLTLAGLVNSGSASGSGEIMGGGSLVNQAGGVIDGAGPGALTLTTTGAVVTNGGTLEATGGGGLILQGVSVAGAGGSILAGAGSTVTLQASMVGGGTFGTATGGVISLGDGVAATLDGLLANAGTIALGGAGSPTSLVFDANTSLTGGGVVSLGANKNNTLTATQLSVVLTNIDNRIEGSGKLGGNRMTLVNQAGGVIDADGKVALTLASGAKTIANAGLIEATNKGKGVIASAVLNTGTLEAAGGTLTLQAAVTGSGAVDVASGTLDIANANAAEAVTFTGKTGTLQLDQSRTFTGAVSGFSKAGKTTLDLRDIGFVSAGEARFSGSATSGVLTVTDGTHTAHIALTGNYTGATFTAASDGHGGVKIIDTPTPAPHAFVAAMASLGSGASAAAPFDPDRYLEAPILCAREPSRGL
jgi:hypothetical protein